MPPLRGGKGAKPSHIGLLLCPLMPANLGKVAKPEAALTSLSWYVRIRQAGGLRARATNLLHDERGGCDHQ